MDIAPVSMSVDEVLGIHLALFEAIMTALALGLALFGFVGYFTVREAAERRAED